MIFTFIGIALGVSATASATTVNFPSFSSSAGLTLNGSAATTATTDGDVLRLTPATVSQSGSAFSTTTINAASFSTAFKFRITAPGGTIFDCNSGAGADGLVFVVQNVSSSIGGSRQGIGYQGIGHSVGVEWDTWCNGANNDPSSNHLGIDVDGSVVHTAGNAVDVATRFDDGNLWYGWVDYNGTSLEVRTNQTGIRPTDANLSRTLDITAILGATTAYVGFTSGTGADWGNHDILSWTYLDHLDPIGNQVPEPSSLLLLVPGLSMLRLRKRRTA